MEWSVSDIGVGAVFTAVIYVGFEFYNMLVIPVVAKLQSHRIPDRAKRLDPLSTLDKTFITFSRLITAMFVYHCICFVRATEISGMSTDFFSSAALLDAVCKLPIHIPFLFIIYDFFYTLFHWALHWPPIYPWIHKHHHRQMTPYRGNPDAINVHPIEYIIGEYDHLFSMWILTKIFGPGVHALSFIVFIAVGGALASLNHTRIDVQLPYVFNVRAHDFHHRQPRCNYGQYLMLWDCVFGTFMPSEARSTDKDAAKVKAKAGEEYSNFVKKD